MIAFRVLAPLALLSLTACPGPLPDLPPAPSEVAAQTELDEQAALTITLAYTAAARAAALAIETGVVKDRATISRIGGYDRQAYAAVEGVEHAYRAGNAISYTAAVADARAAITSFLDSVKGPAR